jgi:GTP-binding protein EngB required for normal cell division
MACVSRCNEVSPLEPILEKALKTLQDLGPDFKHHHRRISDLKDRFTHGLFHLAVLGQFKRGKSTLLNALSGESILPMGVLPLTAAPTLIQYGPHPKITVRFRNGRPPEEFTDPSTLELTSRLSRFVTEEGNPKNIHGVSEVDVKLPSPLLREGVVLIDTPGIGSTHRHNTLATLNFLQQCDAALFLVSADPPITEVELDFLKQVREKVPRLFFVLNKIDYLDEQERKQALSFYQKVLTEQGAWDDTLPIFSLSARKGLKARTEGDSEAWAESGMAALESFLVDFLAKEKFSALTEAVSRRTSETLEAVLMDAGIAVKALEAPWHELEKKIILFDNALKQAETERTLIQDVLEGDKKRLTRFVEDLASEMRRDADAFLKALMNSPSCASKSTGHGVEQRWGEAIPKYFGDQQEKLDEKVKARLLACLSPHEAHISRIVETLRHTAADLFQVTYKPLGEDDALEIQRRPYWVLNTWNADPLPILKNTDQRREELVRRNVENIRWAMLQNLNLSFARFSTKVKEHLTETVAAAQTAMAKATRLRAAKNGSIDEETARWKSRISRLEQIQSNLK